MVGFWGRCKCEQEEFVVQDVDFVWCVEQVFVGVDEWICMIIDEFLFVEVEFGELLMVDLCWVFVVVWMYLWEVFQLYQFNYDEILDIFEELCMWNVCILQFCDWVQDFFDEKMVVFVEFVVKVCCVLEIIVQV